MQPLLQAQLKTLERFRLFSNVGQVSDDYSHVRDWKSAIKSCTGEIWSSVQFQVSNYFAREVRKRSYERSEQWNGLVEEIQQRLRPLLATAIDGAVKNASLNSLLYGAAAWDMLMICLEAEYSDLISPMFFIPRLCPIYASGHFPCGWEGPKLNEGLQGELPVSRIIIY